MSRILEKIPYDAEFDLIKNRIPKDAQGTQWVDNEPFEDTIKIDCYSEGHESQGVFSASSLTKPNQKYKIFSSDLIKMIARNSIDNGVLKGKFRYCRSLFDKNPQMIGILLCD